MNAPLVRVAQLLRAARLDLAADNAAYEAAEKARKFNQALELIQEDAARDNKWAAHFVRVYACRTSNQ